jgi:lipopolysaccharide export system protein LptC
MAHAAEFMNDPEGLSPSVLRRRRAAFGAAARHSRRVRWLKVAILCGSLAGIAALLVIGLYDPFGRIPGHISIGGASLNGSQVTMEKPKLTGYKRDGRPYELLAASGVQNLKTPSLVQLNEIDAHMTMPDDSVVRLVSSQGLYDSKTDFMRLPHAVRVTSNAGYDARLQSADLDFKAGTIVTTQPVTVAARSATIAADALAIAENGKVVVFTGNVRSTLVRGVEAAKAKEGGR